MSVQDDAGRYHGPNGEEYRAGRAGGLAYAYAMGLGALAGAAMQAGQARLWPCGWYLGLGLAALLLLALVVRMPPRGRNAAIFGVLVGLGLLFAWAGLRGQMALQQRLDLSLEGQDIRVTGMVAAMPRIQPGVVRFRLAVESAMRADGQPVRLPPLLDIAWYAQGRFSSGGTAGPAREMDGLPGLQAGERWGMTVRLRAPHGAFNPHGFDYERWLWEQGVHATGYVRTASAATAPERLPARLVWQPGVQVERLRQHVRDAMFRHLLHGAEGTAQWRQASGVVAALVTGDQRLIDPQAWEVFRATGVAHLMAISGLHITMFAWLAMGVAGWLWRRVPGGPLFVPAPVAAIAGGVLLAAAYAIFSGWGVPAQRTCLMLGVWALLRLSGRRWPWHATLLLAAVAVVLWQPLALWQAGFWLSFVAVAVLLGMVESADGRAAAADGPDAVHSDGGHMGGGRAAWRGLGAFVAGLARLQWRISLALAPLTVLLFGQVSLVGLLANMLAIPWVTFIVTPLAMLGVALPWAWTLAAHAMQWLGMLLQWLAQWPAAMFFLPVPPWWLGVAALAGSLLLVASLPWFWRLQGLPVLLLLGLWQPPRPAEGEFRLLAADVGQGSAVLVQTRRHALLYDSGPRYSAWNNAGKSVLVPLLRALGEAPDVLALSHSDADHTGGADDVLLAFSKARVLAPFAYEDKRVAAAPHGFCHAGMRWQWDGVQFAFLHPLPEALPTLAGGNGETAGLPAPAASNAMSCVLHIRSASGAAALLTGDIGHLQELDLQLRDPVGLRADFLLAAHHGSGSSSSRRFIEAVGPQVAVAQAGYRNAFGHPAREVVQRFAVAGVTFRATPKCGAAVWHSASPAALRCDRQSRRRYWHHPQP